ncbi:unnamed protein product [Urochloa decumbens]|uniref:Protein FAR1-RELATED SEQUENCE n=1 Tax=Urochloa decumbens TaxID=240449 RepID=A0ABC8WFS8_9POAL
MATGSAATADVPGSVVDTRSDDPLHHTSTLMPPATVPLGALQTPDATQLFYPDKNINLILVPRLRQEFSSMEDAYEFYRDYSKLAGFSLTTARTSKETRHWLCYRAGFHKSKKGDGEPNQTEKGSKKCGCPAYIKVKEDKKRNIWECKRNNEYFYWDIDADPDTAVVRNIFWSHASQRAEYRDFGDVVTFDTTHKTNSKHMPLAMFVGANNNLKNVTFGQALIGDETSRSFTWLFETFLNCMGGRQPHVILTDEDPAMRIAIGLVLNKSQHWNCRWHITRIWEYDLDQLFSQHKDKNLKERFESLINYPLGPMQFEVEWKKLVDKCGIADHPAIRALRDKRERWIATYFKGMYCGRMTSTQRSESQNRVLKDGYVNESTSLHMFTKRMLDSLQHAGHMDAGLFCMHIIRAFTHLQVRRIPESYILKRYTRDTRQEVEWDRHDGVRIGGHASKEQTRLSKLLPKLMKLGRAGSRSDRACTEVNRLLDKITPGVEMFPRSIDHESSDPGQSSSGSVVTGTTVLSDGRLVLEPPVSRTKGRSPGKQPRNNVDNELDGNALSTYTKENYGDRECHCCGVRGTHYSTTCPVNPD